MGASSPGAVGQLGPAEGATRSEGNHPMPSRSSLMPVFRRGFLTAMLGGLQTLPGAAILATPSVRLLQGAINPTPDTTAAEFTADIATFSGYANVSPTPPGAVVNPSLGSQGVYLPAMFVGAAATPFVQNTIVGYVVFQGADWVVGERWPDALHVEIGQVGDYVDLAAFVGAVLTADLTS